jgi:signal peptidase complex subunit 1
MDYKGQKLCEEFYQMIIIGFAIIGFIVGFIVQSIPMTLFIHLIGFIVASIICLPNWPFYNRNPIVWQPKSIVTTSESSENTASTIATPTTSK